VADRIDHELRTVCPLYISAQPLPWWMNPKMWERPAFIAELERIGR